MVLGCAQVLQRRSNSRAVMMTTYAAILSLPVGVSLQELGFNATR
jgi:hypothetical protein